MQFNLFCQYFSFDILSSKENQMINGGSEVEMTNAAVFVGSRGVPLAGGGLLGGIFFKKLYLARNFRVCGQWRLWHLAGCDVGVWLEDEEKDAAMLHCLPFCECGFEIWILALAMGVCQVVADLAVLCENRPFLALGSSWVFW